MNLSQIANKIYEDPDLSTHVLVFMVREIMSDYSLPSMLYPCVGFMSDHLGSAFWPPTGLLEGIGLKVLAWVSLEYTEILVVNIGV